MYGRLSFTADNFITAVFFIAALALFVLAVRSATDMSFLLLLAFSALIVGLLRLCRVWRTGPTVVQYVWQSGIEVDEGKVVDRRAFSALGGRRGFLSPGSWTFATPDERSLAQVFGALRDLDVRFPQDYKGGSAGEEFEHLRKRGLVSGRYKTPDVFKRAWLVADGEASPPL